MFNKQFNQTIKYGLFLAITLVAVFVPASLLLAKCPERTQYGDTWATLVGELTDMGGASQVRVWFQYGPTRSLDFKTPDQIMTDTGLFCYHVTGLTPNTTYYYQAVLKNKYGTTYGKIYHFTTLGGNPPQPVTVNLYANGADGSLTVPYNTPVTLTWNSTNANTCTASGGWSGSRGLSGSETIYNLTNTQTYTLTCTGPNGSASDSVTVYVNNPPQPVTVNLYANGADGSLTVPYNTPVTLTWNSTNANTCTASGGWSGSRGLSGSETIYNLTNTQTYTLTCTGPNGSASDSVTVYVGSSPSTAFDIAYRVSNRSDGTVYGSSVNADPSEVLAFSLDIAVGNNPVNNVTARVSLPNGITYLGDLKINGIPVSGDIIAGLNLGNLAALEERTISFRAKVADSTSFNLGQTQLISTAIVSSDSGSRSTTASVVVLRGGVLGAATDVSTGLTNNIWIDSFILPLLATGLIVWLLRSRLLNFEQWIDKRKQAYRVYKSEKALNQRLAEIKVKELVKPEV